MGLKLGQLQRGNTYRLRLYEHKELRKIWETNVAKTSGRWRKMHNEGSDISPPNIVTVQFDVYLTMHHSIDLFQITNLMHTSFIL